MPDSALLNIPHLQLIGAIVMGIIAAVASRYLSGRVAPWAQGRTALLSLLLIALWAVGGSAIAARFSLGLGRTTNLSDTFPWGLWIAFDMLSGVALAAGGFLLAGAVYIFRLEKFHPVLRPAILTAYLGYLLAVGGLLVDLGRPYNIWHPIIYWQHRSVMFEVAWCVTLYTTVLTLEFLPVLLERLRWRRILRIVRSFTIPLVIAGIILSTLHQSSLGSLFLIVPKKLLHLWYSPFLPVFFFLSALSVGMAMLIFESTLSSWAFHKSLHRDVVAALARAMPVVLVPYLLLRIIDLTWHAAWVYAFRFPLQGGTFVAELLLFLGPALVLLRPQWASDSRIAFWTSVAVIAGVVLNRLNVCWFGMLPSAGVVYRPSWRELVITLNLLSYGVVLFGLAARYLPVFAETHGEKA